MKLCSIVIGLLMTTSSAINVASIDVPVATPQLVSDSKPDQKSNLDGNKDIGKDEVRPDVYKVVFKNVGPVPESRRKNPPKSSKSDEDEDSFVKKWNWYSQFSFNIVEINCRAHPSYLRWIRRVILEKMSIMLKSLAVELSYRKTVQVIRPPFLQLIKWVIYS